MSNIIFQKSYTRDDSLIIQQLWFDANNQMLKKYLATDDFFGIDYINNGIIEVWENTLLVKAIEERLVKMSLENKLEILSIINEYKSGLVSLEEVWQGPSLSRKELSLFIEKIGSYMLACLIYTYLSVGEKADPEIKNICADLRSKDHFFASSDALFRESLKKIFPEVAQYVVCIRKEEIESGVPTLEVLKSRYNNFLYFSNGDFHIQPLENYKLNSPQLIFNEDVIAGTEDILFGHTANKGRVVGKVKIIIKAEKGIVRKI